MNLIKSKFHLHVILINSKFVLVTFVHSFVTCQLLKLGHMKTLRCVLRRQGVVHGIQCDCKCLIAYLISINVVYQIADTLLYFVGGFQVQQNWWKIIKIRLYQ